MTSRMSERLFKYPPMERQDLNQSQLGSFKFTPVDPVDLKSLTQSANQFLEQQFFQRQRLSVASASSTGAFQDSASTLSSDRGAHQPNQYAIDTEFFNKHIKPDLGDSRLRLGPAALRSAVDGASPAKKQSLIHVQPEPDLSVKYHRPSNSINVTSPQYPAAIMDPTAATFMPTADALSPAVSDPVSISETLCNALANEQRTHNITKATLAQHITRCIELEDQLRKSKQQIASMTVTIKSLGAIIKHNTSKQNSEQDGSHTTLGYSEEAEEVALRDFYREYNRLRGAAQKGEEGTGKGKELDNNDSRQENDPTKQEAVEVVDDAQLYNLDLLVKPDAGDSAESVLRRTLRKHFSLDSSADDGKAPETPQNKRDTLTRLVDISPESGAGSKDAMRAKGHVPVTNGNGSLTRTQIRPSVSGQIYNRSLPVSVTWRVSLTVTQSSEVVAKSGHQNVSLIQCNGADLEMEHIGNLDALGRSEDAVKPPQDVKDGGLSPISSANDEDGRSTTAVVSPTNQPRKERITLKIGSNLYGETKWLINKDYPIFETGEEKFEAVGGNGTAFHRNSPFPNHPVRYLPEDAASTIDAYRTVMIDEIPAGSTMLDVLNIVKGGSVESIQLFPPIGNATSFMTARVVFVFERSAHNMIKHQEAKSKEDAGARRFKIKDVVVRCWMPTDPTYPRNYEVDHEIFGDNQATRIIFVDKVDEYVYNLLPYKIRSPYDQHVIEYSYTVEGSASIEFSDIKSAIKVKAILEKDRGMWPAQLRYAEDYTCVPYVHGEPMGA
ncbi:hypothetical protein G647_01226 [Cladophialophora carrionii CBS 160.54]|uniref:Uncharacterized protein n=1 Tax=Cladophialophora carrionii CBS 160.54 TaxID=1279043 RepID=V9DPG6_9EURO|nr:uncharacterized protein G647_01226 [Cladophialophora carrionii CBS 160.54]ETI28775.1 hypothetical protein G647_01226 [Cladophialophora carrionii CBS 160.54]